MFTWEENLEGGIIDKLIKKDKIKINHLMDDLIKKDVPRDKALERCKKMRKKRK